MALEIVLRATKRKLITGAALLQSDNDDESIYDLKDEEDLEYVSEKVTGSQGVVRIVGFNMGKSGLGGEVGSFQPLVIMSDERQDDVEESSRIINRRIKEAVKQMKKEAKK